jgi:hypothetical protein
METAVQQETVTFYHWLGIKPDKSAYPSSEIVHISGGERVLGANGIPIKAPMKEARFHNGIFSTDDPEVIAVLRKFCSRAGSGYTENYEEYLAAVQTPAERLKRQANIGQLAEEQKQELLTENSRLRATIARLEGKSKQS